MALKNYATQLGTQRRIDLSTTYDKAMAPFQGSWKTLDRITYVNLRNQRNVLENLSLATLKEMMGLGPRLYFVLRSYNPKFETFLILALHYLPKEKFCIYPLEQVLEGPFLYAPWDSLGRTICSGTTISIDCFIAYL